MNPAARAVFALRLEDFSASLPASLIGRFAHFAEGKQGGFAKVKIPGAASLSCSIEILKLADGQDGLIVAEVGDEEERQATPAPANFRKAKSESKKTLKKAPANSAQPRRKTLQTPAALTAEEMRAFKAVGRKVLRLCVDKKCLKELPAAAALPAPASSESPSPESPAQPLTEVLAAFDLVLFLSEGLDIVGVQGRATRLGWRKAKLARKTVHDLFAPYDRALLRRMLKKLRGQSVYGSRDTLVVCSENGKALPCRAVAGRWDQDNAAFFLAFISLEPPARLKRSQAANRVAAGASRLSSGDLLQLRNRATRGSP